MKTTIATNPTNQSEDHPSDIVTYQIYSNHVFFLDGIIHFWGLTITSDPTKHSPNIAGDQHPATERQLPEFLRREFPSLWTHGTDLEEVPQLAAAAL